MDAGIAGVDIGGTGSRLRVTIGQFGRSYEVTGPPAAVVAGRSTVPDVVRDLCRGFAAQFGGRPRVAAAAVGMRGFRSMTQAGILDPNRVHDILAEELRTSSTAVSSDAVTAHLGALGAGPGATLAVGTGAVAVACDDVGRWHLADGMGPHVGDNGGGAWIGRRGLDAAARSMDGRRMGASPALVRAAEQHFGRRERWTAVNDVSLFAGFAPQVIAAADYGDLACREILDEAARSLADGLCAVLSHPGVAPVAVTTGKLLLHAPMFRSMVIRHLLEKRGDVRVQPTAGLPLDGALALARMLTAYPDVVQEHVPLLAVRISSAPRPDDSITLPRVVLPVVRPFRAESVPTAWVVEVRSDHEWSADQVAEDRLTPAASVDTVVPLTGERLVVGRASRSRGVLPDIVCEDTGVSRRHCEIAWKEGGWSVVDLGSANGTYVAARGDALPTVPLRPGERRWLADGDRIYVGGWTCLTARAVTASVR
ncbi:N-acetylglucosamine kinase-like BadF-type ATPase [Promicromonospora sp. AC04]|uniref:BadF/BadG/BcrA/BcrD ATPase family protein n=1 Tax=Promicromonospora sp. AC04 TaxID=2135723 RepID=UPI000D381709|nr:BadF/BadG/BcrA/BcrD ATPase family protein [Promicromonospora sp. AC04]PUB20314.1 N-acetylglucosamine kinase-like BadF-type ATPase [Promicromonospora sp. AC04]